MRYFKFTGRSILAALFVLALAGCETPMAPKYPELTFSHLPKITLSVAEIRIVDQYRPAGGAVHVEDQMPVSPKTALHTWAGDRLQAGGVSGVANFIIENASVVEVPLSKTPGLKGAFTKDQSERYDADIRVSIKLEGVPRVSQAFALAEVERSQTIAEDASVYDREQMWFDLTEALMKDFDPVMSQSIREHLGDFVR